MSQEKSKVVVPEKVIGTKSTGVEFEITEKEALLYAVGIGFNLDPLKQEDFKFTNELSSDFSVFPTITSTMRGSPGFQLVFGCQYIPQFPLYNLLHGEEKLFMVQPSINVGVKYQNEYEIIDIQDKGKNAVVYVQTTCYAKNEKGEREKAFYIQRSYFIKGIGGFGFKGNNTSKPIKNPPQTKPDYQIIEKTFPNQCFIYRLCEDVNPLHIDPGMASAAGFEKPIIHGLATYGTVARGLVQNLLGGNQTAVKSIEVKFIGHVFPGESLKINVWKDGNRRIFEAEVIERQKKVVNGVLTIREEAKL